MELSKFADADVDSKVNRDQMLRDIVIANSMIAPEFEYLDLETPLKPKGFMDMFKSSFNNRPVESDLNPTPLKKEGWNTQH